MDCCVCTDRAQNQQEITGQWAPSPGENEMVDVVAGPVMVKEGQESKEKESQFPDKGTAEKRPWLQDNTNTSPPQNDQAKPTGPESTKASTPSDIPITLAGVTLEDVEDRLSSDESLRRRSVDEAERQRIAAPKAERRQAALEHVRDGPGMTVEFIRTDGKRQSIEFKRRPLQMDVYNTSPIRIKAVYLGQGLEGGVQPNWQVFAVNGESFVNRLFPDIWKSWETATKVLRYQAPTITMDFQTGAEGEPIKTVAFSRRPLNIEFSSSTPIAITTVRPGPAMEAGVQKGWRLRAVNGTTTHMLNPKQAVELMQKHVAVLQES